MDEGLLEFCREFFGDEGRAAEISGLADDLGVSVSVVAPWDEASGSWRLDVSSGEGDSVPVFVSPGFRARVMSPEVVFMGDLQAAMLRVSGRVRKRREAALEAGQRALEDRVTGVEAREGAAAKPDGGA